MTRLRAIGFAALGVAFVRSPRYLGDTLADAVDLKAPDVRNERTFWRRVARAYELLPGELPELQARLAAKYCRNLDIWKALPSLHRDYRLFLVHTGPSTTLACWRGEYRLDETFDGLVEAVADGLTARDPALYELLATLAGLAPEECAVVDSTQAGVEAAETAGLSAYRYGSAYGLLRWLQAQHGSLVERSARR